MQLQTRREIRSFLKPLEFSSWEALLKTVLCLACAQAVAFFPEHAGLEPAGRWTLFILVLAAGLWLSEAIPAFAVAILIIGLEIAILGRPGGVFAKDDQTWRIFVEPWSSPLIWLFFGGFVLAEGAAKTGLDHWFSSRVLSRFGTKPSHVLLGAMALTFCFSMFMSNTATTAMMMAILAPVAAAQGEDSSFGKVICLGVPFAANLGGMGTIIGSPPNAIAVGALKAEGVADVNFIHWMVYGLPPAVVLTAIVWVYLGRKIPKDTPPVDLTSLKQDSTELPMAPMWQRILVMMVFFTTVGLWIGGPFIGMPAAVVSFIPITVFSVTGIIGVKEIRSLNWDILLLLAGGLALGVAVARTQLAEWLVASLHLKSLAPLSVAVIMACACSVLSNFMSNTAAANVLVPIGLALGQTGGLTIVLALGMAASTAMCLPISTPPNAIAYSTGRLKNSDFLKGGAIVGVLAIAMIVTWILVLQKYVFR